jgi:hypothetical protein
MSAERTNQALGEVPLVDHEEGLHTGAALLAAFQEAGHQMSNSVTAVEPLGCFSEHSKAFYGRWTNSQWQRLKSWAWAHDPANRSRRRYREPGVAITAWLVTPQRTANIG